MQENVIKTHLAQSIEKTEYETQYDENVKLLLSDKQVLARIVKHRTEEFKDYNILEIIECIEGEPDVSNVSIIPGRNRKDAITGMNSESKEANEGEVTFDVRFYMFTKEEKRIKIILNIEAQKNYYPGYHFEPRAVFYCARMISEQLDREFTPQNYDELKKVYSIWVFFDTSIKDSDTITEYRLDKKDVYGKPVQGGKYDYLSISFIRLNTGKLKESKDSLIRMLDVLFSNELDVNCKKIILEKEYQMNMTRKIVGGLNTMCNVSLGIREKGIEEGEQRKIREIISNMLKLNMPVDTISKSVGITEEEVIEIANKLMCLKQ